MTTPRICRLRHIHLTDDRARARFEDEADVDRIDRRIAQTETDLADLTETLAWLRQLRARRVADHHGSSMATTYPREDGRALPDWSELSQAERERLAAQTPYRLQTIMYAADVTDVPEDAFATDAADADRRLAALLDTDPDTRQYFGKWTFGKVAHEPDPMRAAEAEYYLCDALIEYGNQHYGRVWAEDHPVLDHTLYGRYQHRSPYRPAGDPLATTDFDRFAPASGPGTDGLIHRLTPTRRDYNGLLFGLCGATVTEELPYYEHVNCPDCAAALAGRPSTRD